MIFRPGKPSDAIVTDREFAADPDCPGDHLEYYGGHVVAESVAPKFKPLLMAAPELLAACEAVVRSWSHPQIGKPDGSTGSARAHAVVLCEQATARAKGGA